MLLLVLTSLAHDYAKFEPWLIELGARARAAGKGIGVTFLAECDGLDKLRRCG